MNDEQRIEIICTTSAFLATLKALHDSPSNLRLTNNSKKRTGTTEAHERRDDYA